MVCAPATCQQAAVLPQQSPKCAHMYLCNYMPRHVISLFHEWCPVHASPCHSKLVGLNVCFCFYLERQFHYAILDDLDLARSSRLALNSQRFVCLSSLGARMVYFYYLCLQGVRQECPQSPEEGVRCPGAGVMDACGAPCVVLGTEQSFSTGAMCALDR